MIDIKEKCSVCEISRDLVGRFYLNSKFGENLCGKHYSQLSRHGRVTDISQPEINNKMTYWKLEEENKLREMVQKNIPYKEISEILSKTILSISAKVASLNIKTKYKNNINYHAIYQDFDWCYQKYIIEGLNHEEMAEEANCSKRVVEKWCVEKHRLTQKFRQENKTLSSLQKDLIIGSMLGDGHIDRRETQPVFIVVHAENQKDYLYYKYNILKDLCNKEPSYIEEGEYIINDKRGISQPAYRICTRIYDCFKEYRNKSYTYLLNLMNEYSFSIWVLDDGYRSRSNWELCVAEYTPKDVENALNILKEKYNIIGNIEKDTRYVLFNAESSRKIDKMILHNIPNNLDVVKYKILENQDICEPQKRLYVDKEKAITLIDYCKIHNLNYKYVWQKLKDGFTIKQITKQEVVNI